MSKLGITPVVSVSAAKAISAPSGEMSYESAPGSAFESCRPVPSVTGLGSPPSMPMVNTCASRSSSQRSQ